MEQSPATASIEDRLYIGSDGFSSIDPLMSPFSSQARSVVLCILDGWGIRDKSDDNAISLAQTPVWDRLIATYPFSTLEACEAHVGLPAGQMGNSEVGHTTLGAGRVVWQDLPRIDAALAKNALESNPHWHRFITQLKHSGGVCHLLGLMSHGGVHCHQDHMAQLAVKLAQAGVPVALHAFLDGRDCAPRSALGCLHAFTQSLEGQENIRLATLTGRFYAMDRDRRWERIERAYRALTDAIGLQTNDAATALRNAYESGESDEFIAPLVMSGYRGMQDGDGLLMTNFRADRAREILTALLDPAFEGFTRKRRVHFAARLGMVRYSSALASSMGEPLFPPLLLNDTFGETVSRAGLRQLRIAETEKYAHVTFFFNGGKETLFPGEERILIPSPKVKTYDLQPAMAAEELTDQLIAAIEKKDREAIVVNYANPDMVGHTGNLAAAIEAVETVDRCLGRLEEAVRRVGGVMLVTADHGNIEQMVDPATQQPHTAHTLNPVPAVLVNAPAGIRLVSRGTLADVAPTLLALLGVKRPSDMTGASLLTGCVLAGAAD